MIYGANDTTSLQGVFDNIPWWAYFGLVIVPTGIGGTNVVFRSSRNTHFVTMAMHKYFLTIPALILMIWYQGKLSFDIL